MTDNANDTKVEELIRKLGTTMGESFMRVHADILCVSGDIEVVKDRVTAVESRQTQIDNWRRNSSDRVREVVRETSEHDLSHDAKLATEIEARLTLEQKVDLLVKTQDTQLAILTNLQKIAKNPIVKEGAKIIGTAVLTWLSIKYGVPLTK